MRKGARGGGPSAVPRAGHRLPRTWCTDELGLSRECSTWSGRAFLLDPSAESESAVVAPRGLHPVGTSGSVLAAAIVAAGPGRSERLELEHRVAGGRHDRMGVLRAIFDPRPGRECRRVVLAASDYPPAAGRGRGVANRERPTAAPQDGLESCVDVTRRAGRSPRDTPPPRYTAFAPARPPELHRLRAGPPGRRRSAPARSLGRRAVEGELARRVLESYGLWTAMAWLEEGLAARADPQRGPD